MVKLEGVLYVLLLLLPLATLQHDRDDWYSEQEDVDALNLLRTIKRRVSNQLKLQQDSSASDNDHNVNVLATVKRRQRDCRSWNDPCVPWSSDADESCCNSRRFVCRCNLWMQNCRCVSRAWGK